MEYEISSNKKAAQLQEDMLHGVPVLPQVPTEKQSGSRWSGVLVWGLFLGMSAVAALGWFYQAGHVENVMGDIDTTSSASVATASVARIESDIDTATDALRGWATFRSRYGVMFQYNPEGVVPMRGGSHGSDAFVLFPVLQGRITNGVPLMQIEIFASSTNSSSLEQLTQEYQKSRWSSDVHPEFGEYFPVTFRGMEGLHATHRLAQSGKYKHNYRYEQYFLRGQGVTFSFGYVSAYEETLPRVSATTSERYWTDQRDGEYRSLVVGASRVLETVQVGLQSRSAVESVKTSMPQDISASSSYQQALAELRAPPFFDTSKNYFSSIFNRSQCESGSSTPAEADSVGGLSISKSLFFGMYDAQFDIHGDDAYGHIGVIPGERSSTEDLSRTFSFIDLGPSADGISIRSFANATITLAANTRAHEDNKKRGIFEITGEGNRCTVAGLALPYTPYAVHTIPLTEVGDIGAISSDLDGDGIQDMQFSLIYPVTYEKSVQLKRLLQLIATSSYWLPMRGQVAEPGVGDLTTQ